MTKATLKPIKPRDAFVKFLGDKRHPSKNDIVTTSLEIAKRFGKEHKNIIRAIENLQQMNATAGLNFALSYRIDKSGKSSKYYKMTRDGMSLLIMGFTGKKALEWKLKFIEAFNAMEKWILEQHNYQSTIDLTRQMTDLLLSMGYGDLIFNDGKSFPMGVYQWINSTLNKHIIGLYTKGQIKAKYGETRASLSIRETIRQHDSRLNDKFVTVENYLIKHVIPFTTEETFFLTVEQKIIQILALL